MNKLRTYQEFLTENKINESNINEFEYFMDKIMELPTEEILTLKNDIQEEIEGENFIGESISSFINKLKHRFSSWIDDKLFNFLINRKKSFYSELVDKLNLFDLTTLDDVKKAFPSMKMKSIYLAGGMDDADDGGAGWRNTLEYEFEVNNPGKKNPILHEINIGDVNVNPSYCVDGIYLDMFLENPNKTMAEFYDRPALLNPVRKEVDRSKDDQFDNAIAGLKKPGYDPTKDMSHMRYFQKTFSETIEPDDEHLLRISDAVWLGYNPTAGAGTYGELELLSLIRKPLFAWLLGDYENKAGTFKLWTIPHLSKVARNKEEMAILVNTIKKYTN
tara:strand:- start:64500 stop:65495 length:996 start_codon:yes stop_codon:yes gene_type:complete